MRNDVRDFLRDLALVAIAAALTAFMAIGHGITDTTMDDVKIMADAAAAAVATVVVLALTPITKRYGVGKKKK